MVRYFVAGNLLLATVFAVFLRGLDWRVIYFFANALWSVFWSYAPTPKPETWYNAVFHTAQWIAFNPGRSLNVAHQHKIQQLVSSNPERVGYVKVFDESTREQSK